jgi:hypothetical protein
VSLSSRNIISMCVILFATTTLSGLGPITLAAHEILRQVWIFAIQVLHFACTCAGPQLSIFFQPSRCFTDLWGFSHCTTPTIMHCRDRHSRRWTSRHRRWWRRTRGSTCMRGPLR